MKQQKNGKKDYQVKYKFCNKCRKWKNMIYFTNRYDTKDGKNTICGCCECDNKLRNRYGISLTRYDEMLRLQRYRCYICNTDEANNKHGTFVVDHCHYTGKVRKLLCDPCNKKLGIIESHQVEVEQFIDYIDEHSKPTI